MRGDIARKSKLGYEDEVIAQFAFDTLAFVKRLSAAGMETGQAEALAEALTGQVFNEFATRADLEALGSGLKADLEALELRLNNKIENLELRLGSKMESLELRLTIRMGVVLTAATAILGTLITLN